MKLTAALFATSTAIILGACTSSDTSGNVQALPGTGVPCARTIDAEVFDGRTVCIDQVGDYEVVVIPGDSESVVIVDPGNPTIESSEMISVLALVDEAQRSTFEATYVALMPTNLALPDSCLPIEPFVLPDGCDLGEVAEMHFDDYGTAVSEVSGWFDSSADIHLLAASFGAARWESLLLDPDTIAVDKALFVSPFTSGVSSGELGEGLNMAARPIFQKIVDGCVQPDCFASFGDPTDPESCPGFSCRPDEIIAEIAGVSPEEALLGMYGLMPVADLNAELLFEAINNRDSEQLSMFLAQGRSSMLGLNTFDLITESHVHFLATLCSVLADEDDHYGPFAECAGFQTRVEFPPHDFFSETYLPDTCFYSAQPDPVLGYASNRGFRFGDSMRSTIEPLRSFVHGDLELGATRLVELISTNECPRPAGY